MVPLVGSKAPEISPSRVDLPIPAKHGDPFAVCPLSEMHLVMFATQLSELNPTLVTFTAVCFSDAGGCLCLDNAEVLFDVSGAFESRAFAKGSLLMLYS